MKYCIYAAAITTTAAAAPPESNIKLCSPLVS